MPRNPMVRATLFFRDTVNVASRLLEVAKQQHYRVVAQKICLRAAPDSWIGEGGRVSLCARDGSHSRPSGFHAGPGSQITGAS